ncbi:MAG: rhodanese-like domain-containing protein [Methanomassiliicoccales archaeon]|jgi:rhodanese-related sulfurtransferase
MTGVRFISPTELERLLSMFEKGEFLLLDIRSVAEFRSGHIRNARSIPVEELEKRSHELDRCKRLVIYCRTGKRCLRALPLLVEKGHGEVLVLEGGTERWPGGLVSD